MKIGILSDTHDNLPQIEKAVRFFNKNKVDLVLHAGDFVAPFTIATLDKLSCAWRGIFGNNDGERNGLARVSEGKIKEGPLRLELGQRKITLVHDLSSLNLKSEAADLIIYGHTHKAEVIKKGARLLVNPGECSGWLSGKATVALAEMVCLSAKIFRI